MIAPKHFVNKERYVRFDRRKGWCIFEVVNGQEWLIESGFWTQGAAMKVLCDKQSRSVRVKTGGVT